MWENGKAYEFILENEFGKITNLFLIREVPEKVNGKTYYDIVTPYGYGGPVIRECNNKEQLLKSYEEEFSKFCKENSNYKVQDILSMALYEYMKNNKKDNWI